VIHSDLNGKNHVPEDVLSSNCLGLLSLLPDLDLLGFFTTAENATQEHLVISDIVGASAELEFWPFLRGGGIPDAILTVRTPAALPFKIIIEVKHGAPKSGKGESDQLAAYWRAAQRSFPNRCAVVYLTHHRVLPKAELDDSAQIAGIDAKIFWLGWFDLFLWTRRQLAASALRPSCESRVISALHTYLAAKGYRTFSNWDSLTPASLSVPYSHSYTVSNAQKEIRVPYSRQYFGSVFGQAPKTYTRISSLGRPTGGISLDYARQT
jgi:hypothetical protein